MLTATNVAEVEMWVYFWISSVFALNSSTDLISNRLCSGSRQAMLCLSESSELIRLISGREHSSTLEEDF